MKDFHALTLPEIKQELIALNRGEYEFEQYQALVKFFSDSKDHIASVINKLTIKNIMSNFGPQFQYNYRGDKKDQVVKGAYKTMFAWCNITDKNVSYTFDFSAKEDPYITALKKILDLTEDQYEVHRKDLIAEAQEDDAKKADYEQAVKNSQENPQTVEEMNLFLRAKLDEGLSLRDARLLLSEEQRRNYDREVSEPKRAARVEALNEKRTRLFASQEAAATGGIIETKHTKKGHDLFVVQLDDRVEREEYNRINANAKKLGGYYSSYRAGGAIPGFQFTTRDQAQAFVALIGGDTSQAEEIVQERQDVFKDNKEQTAAERLRTMADALMGRAEDSLNTNRKVNTHSRASMAASAEARAYGEQALAGTMLQIAEKLENGEANFLNQVRMKVQVEFLRSEISKAKQQELQALYPTYGEQQQHVGEPATETTLEYLAFPRFDIERNDLAIIGRKLQEFEVCKKLSNRILELADDITGPYLRWVKDNLILVSCFVKKDGSLASFTTKRDANLAIENSNFKGQAVVYSVKRNEQLLVLSPAEAQRRGLWEGDGRKILTLSEGFANEILEAIDKATKKGNHLHKPWRLVWAKERLDRYKQLGIESGAEMRHMLREFINLNVSTKKPDPVKELERSMIGRVQDGLDFFPTPVDTAITLIDYAEIKEGHTVLEPSAGMGHIADQIRAAGFEPDVCEISGTRRELLNLKGYNVVEHDFLALSEQYDRIIMNPPFSDRRDAQHVQHAFSLLKPGGRLVAIVGEGVFFGSDKKAQAFRAWVESVGGSDEALDSGVFMDPSLPVNTNVNARILVIDKAEESSLSHAA